MRTKILLAVVGITNLLLQNNVLCQSEGKFRIQGKLGSELTSNVNRQPIIDTDEDYRFNFLIEADKNWRDEKNKLSFGYAFQHYRYNDFSQFTRYEQNFKVQYQYNGWKNYRLTVSDEFRLRLYETKTRTNYGRNIFEFSLRKTLNKKNSLTFGYQNWLKDYYEDGLNKYTSHRIFVKYNHEFSRTFNLNTGLEFQRHTGNLYAGSTPEGKDLNAIGKRITLRTNLDKLFSRRLITTWGYKFERDFADDFDIDDILIFEDEEGEELLAEDADFGYMKHQGSLSLLSRISKRWSVLLFSLVYSKGYDFWRLETDHSRRRDTVVFFSPKLRYKINSRFNFDIRYNFERNWTNERDYRYTINGVGIGLSFKP